MVESLTAAERETLVNGSDADDTITVWTAQRPRIRRLRKLTCAEVVEEGTYGKSRWAKFKLPVAALSFRNPASAEVRQRRREAALARGASPRRNRTHESSSPTPTPSPDPVPTSEGSRGRADTGATAGRER
jgi:hypothetical protein